jgi:hypothetical protein
VVGDYKLEYEHRTSIHARIQELDLGPRLLALASSEAVALVDALCCVDGEYLVLSAYFLARNLR